MGEGGYMAIHADRQNLHGWVHGVWTGTRIERAPRHESKRACWQCGTTGEVQQDPHMEDVAFCHECLRRYEAPHTFADLGQA